MSYDDRDVEAHVRGCLLCQQLRAAVASMENRARRAAPDPDPNQLPLDWGGAPDRRGTLTAGRVSGGAQIPSGGESSGEPSSWGHQGFGGIVPEGRHRSRGGT